MNVSSVISIFIISALMLLVVFFVSFVVTLARKMVV